MMERGQTMKSRAALIAVLTILCSAGLAAAEQSEAQPAPAPAPPPETGDDFDALVARAVAAYEAQRYDEAVELFERAYAIQPQPELIYNIARVYERAVRRQEAVEQYERFLELPNTTADLRARALESLQALRREIRALEAPDEPEGPETGPTPPPPPPPEPRDVLGPVGWALIGLGGAALIVGGVFGGLTLTEETATEEANSLDDQQLHLDRGGTYALTADILFGAGGALAVTGAILLIVRATRGGDDAGEGAEEPEVSWRPLMLGGRGLGLSLDGRF